MNQIKFVLNIYESMEIIEFTTVIIFGVILYQFRIFQHVECD